jgi:valyl-tRNA synthetase
MPNQVTSCNRKKQAALLGSRRMVTAWLCLSTSLTTGARAAFVRNHASKSAAFANRAGLSTNFALPSVRMRHGPSRLAASTVTEYDQLNKEKGLDSYTPSEFEKDIYSWWEDSGCFQPDAKQKPSDHEKKPYVLPMPPPNVTGRLHMGHAIFVTLQDVLARFHRMRGRPVLWLPGTFQNLLA